MPRMKLHIVLLFALVGSAVSTESLTIGSGSDASVPDAALDNMAFKDRFTGSDIWNNAASSNGDGSADSQSVSADGSGTFREVFDSSSDSSRGEDTTDIGSRSGSSGSLFDEESTSTSSSASSSNFNEGSDSSNSSSEASSVSSNNEDYSIEDYPSSDDSSSGSRTGSVNLIVDDSASSQSDSISIGAGIYPSISTVAALVVAVVAALV